MSFINKDNYLNQIKGIFIIIAFLLSAIAMVLPLINANSVNPLILLSEQHNQQTGSLQPNPFSNSLSTTSGSSATRHSLLKTTLDPALFNWVNSSTPLKPSQYQFDVNNNPVITVFAQPGSNLQLINKYMHISSFVDLGSLGYIILGSILSASNLVSMTLNNPYIRVSSDPYDATIAKNLSAGNLQSNIYSQSPSITNNGMFISQANNMSCGGNSCNGTGVTIAMVDGGVDFGNSDLQSALALDTQGLPTSFDSEGWSLVATPLTVGKDIPISHDNTTLLFNEVNSTTLDKLKINDPGNVAVNGQPILDLSRGWEYWHNTQDFMSPQNWKINANWIGHVGQAPPKFGVGVEQWSDIETGQHYYGYFYALLLDTNSDGKYDSIVIDMATSAWATYLKYVADGGHAFPSSYIKPDFNFANDKVVTWENNKQRGTLATGADYTFAIDWNNDSVNDWSYGSLANAYNRYNFLPINQTLYGKIVHGVDPQGYGFAALYPFGYGFAEHGTWTSSVAVSRGLVNYNVFSNNTNSWDYPFGNSSTRTLPGSASGASLMSISFGATPQDDLLAWFWAAGFDLTSNVSKNTAIITGAQWKWSGHVRANITSNSWGLGGLYWGGFWGSDWISDLLSLPNLGGNPTYMRNITDLIKSKVMTGSNNGLNLQNVNDTTTFNPFPSSTADTLYVGANNPFMGVGMNITTPSSNPLTFALEYYSGSSWSSLSLNQTPTVTSQGLVWFKFIQPNNWNLSTFQSGVNQLYWIRITASQVSNMAITNLYIEFPNPFIGYPGMLMVVAAGNDNYYQSTSSSFGSLSLKVGATSSSLAYANQYGRNWNVTEYQMAFFSSAGPKANGVPGVDIAAPGFYVYSGTPLYRSIIGSKLSGGDISEFGGNGSYAFVIWAGTSSATPAVAGVAAIAYQAYMSEHPDVAVNPSIIKQIIKSTATNLGFPSNIQGTGMVNASAIVTYIENQSSSNYLMVGSNITYEDQLNISAWLTNTQLGPLSWYFLYSVGDPITDSYDFPVSTNSLLSNYHYDVDLSTSTVSQGTTVNTQVVVQDNNSKLIVKPVESSVSSVVSESYTITNNDQFISPQGDYLANISLRRFNVWSSDYLEITVSNLYSFDNVSLFVWNDLNKNGRIEMANPNNASTSGMGELARVQYMSTRNNQTYAVLQVGNPAIFNSSTEEPFLILRGSPQTNNVYSPTWAVGKVVDISIKAYNLSTDWSNAITVTPWKSVRSTNTTYFNVSINTTGMEAGYHFGYLQFTQINSLHVTLMPVSIKVGFGQIDGSNPANNPSASPTEIGVYNIPYFGTTFNAGFVDGSLIWVPFSVNESVVPYNAVLAIRVTELTHSNATLGFVLHYDETPFSLDASWTQILVSDNNTGIYNGHSVNWQYVAWNSVGFGKGDFVARGGLVRIQTQTTQSIVHYRVGLFTTAADNQTSVKLEMYWLPQMPVVRTTVGTTSTKDSYCQVSVNSTCVSPMNVIFGPNADLSLTATCNPCDPNLPTPDILFNTEQSITDYSTGSFTHGYDPSISVDYWEKRYFQAGDLIEFAELPTNPSAQLLLWLYTPTTLGMINDSIITPVPMNNTGYLLLSDYLFQFGNANGGTYGTFIAKTSGVYWFGIDNYGTVSTNWVLYTKESHGTLEDLNTNTMNYNTMTSPQFGLKTEATYDLQNGSYSNPTNLVVGAATPTGLSISPYSVDVSIDNYVAPFLTLSNSTLALNNTVLGKNNGKVDLNWNVTDFNGNSFLSNVYFLGPLSNDTFSYQTGTTSYSWDFSSSQYSIGWWTLVFFADDSQDPSNTINGTDYGGPGFPVFIRVFIQNSVSTNGNSSLFNLLSTGFIGAIIGAIAVGLGALTYVRRAEMKNKLNKLGNSTKNGLRQLQTSVRSQIDKHRGPK